MSSSIWSDGFAACMLIIDPVESEVSQLLKLLELEPRYRAWRLRDGGQWEGGVDGCIRAGCEKDHLVRWSQWQLLEI